MFGRLKVQTYFLEPMSLMPLVSLGRGRLWFIEPGWENDYPLGKLQV